MKICGRGVNFIQVINAEGDVRTCSWMNNCMIGNLLEEDLEEIQHGKKAKEIRQTLVDGSYRYCVKDNCPYLANGNMEDILIDIDEIPDYPSELHLAYEGVCNYNCTCCTSHEHMEMTKKHDYSKNYDLLEEKLKQILPYVKHIGANGRGELFASKRILKLLQEWTPIAPPEEISVELETNGSLFDERHWKQIENLGQYHLSVYITVMSFQEDVYQHLSGCNYPISKIEDNLRFVKQLREKGVIDYLELATVLQEENFREMPEFTERCIREFGADCVRIRPVMPGGRYDAGIQWFMDVRNPEHPYYEQYVKVMKNPIFRHPKVLLWSGDLASTRGKHPGVKSGWIQRAADRMLDDPGYMQSVLEKAVRNKEGVPEISLYGIGTLGKLFLKLNGGQVNVKKIYDKNSRIRAYEDIPVEKPEMETKNQDTVLVTVYEAFEQIRQNLREVGFEGEIVDLYELIK